MDPCELLLGRRGIIQQPGFKLSRAAQQLANINERRCN